MILLWRLGREHSNNDFITSPHPLPPHSSPSSSLGDGSAVFSLVASDDDDNDDEGKSAGSTTTRRRSSREMASGRRWWDRSMMAWVLSNRFMEKKHGEATERTSFPPHPWNGNGYDGANWCDRSTPPLFPQSAPCVVVVPFRATVHHICPCTP